MPPSVSGSEADNNCSDTDASETSNTRNSCSGTKSLARVFTNALSKRSKPKKRAGILAPYLKLARWISRAYDPFIDFQEIFAIGLHADANPDWLDTVPDESPTPIDRRGLCFYLYKRMKAIAGFEELVNSLQERDMDSNEDNGIDRFAQELGSAVSAAHSDDCGSLKEAGLTYVAVDQVGATLQPPIPPKSAKSVYRGFKHPVLARLLCPIDRLEEFDANPAEMMSKLEDGQIPVTAQDLPSFLYAEEEYDPEDMESGLLRGPLLVRTWRHIFTSPTSATKDTPGPGPTKGCQAKLNGLEDVKPRTIAYAALQTYWFLCSQEDWRMEEGLFNKEAFFQVITQLFEPDRPVDGSQEWAEETIQWWTDQVFAKRAIEQHANPSRPSNFSKLLSQRAAKNRKLQAAQHAANLEAEALTHEIPLTSYSAPSSSKRTPAVSPPPRSPPPSSPPPRSLHSRSPTSQASMDLSPLSSPTSSPACGNDKSQNTKKVHRTITISPAALTDDKTKKRKGKQKEISSSEVLTATNVEKRQKLTASSGLPKRPKPQAVPSRRSERRR